MESRCCCSWGAICWGAGDCLLNTTVCGGGTAPSPEGPLTPGGQTPGPRAEAADGGTTLLGSDCFTPTKSSSARRFIANYIWESASRRH